MRVYEDDRQVGHGRQCGWGRQAWTLGNMQSPSWAYSQIPAITCSVFGHILSFIKFDTGLMELIYSKTCLSGHL